MRDKVVIYDQIYNPAVSGAIAPSTFVDLATLNAAERCYVIEEAYFWPPFTALGAPADMMDLEFRIDGAVYPPAPSRLHVRGRADRNMAVPFDTRYAVKTIPLGKIGLDAIEDTTIKVTPGQRIAMRLYAGTALGILATDTRMRIMLVGRIAESDEELRDIYGGSNYDPTPRRLGDPVTGKVTPVIQKPLSISIDNAKYMSGAIGQKAPAIFPYWSWAQNHNVINPVPEYEWSYELANVDFDWQDMRFDWSRKAAEALQIRYLGAQINLGAGLLWWYQPPLRRPGHKNLFYGWVVNDGFPNMLPTGGALALAGSGMFKGPLDLREVGPQLLLWNNFTELRATADAGTTIAARDLEVQLRGVHIDF